MDRKIQKKKWTPKKIAMYAIAAVFVAAVLYIFLMDRGSRLNVEKERLMISEVEFGPFQEFIPVQGEALPIQTFFLDASEGGRVTEKFVKEGTFLNVGDPIIQLENAQLTLSIMYNEAQLFQQINNLRSTKLSMEQNRLNLMAQLLNIEYDLKNQQRKYNNDKKMFEKQLISQIEYEESRDQFEYLQGKKELTMQTYRQDSLFRSLQVLELEKSVQRMQRNLDVAKQQLEKLTVNAPIKGQLTSLKIEIGQSINRGENIGKIDNVDSFKVRLLIDEYWITRVKEGQMGKVTFDNEEYRLRTVTVYPEVTDGRFAADMVFEDKVPADIRKGLTFHIKLELGNQKEALLLDRGGFYSTTGGNWVYVLDPSGTFAVKRQITLGLKNPQKFEVLEGLEPGEKVIVSSYENFGDAEKLIIND